MKPVPDELLTQAFALASFLHRERTVARRLTALALESLETTTLTQDRRLYYVGQRTKISFTELHLLQRLIYEKSEPFERAREATLTAPLGNERLLVHFIKHLVWISVRHNSLYVTLGLGRLLHTYTTAETLELYNVVIQDPARVPAEDYLRDRKKVLMKALQKRFGELLTQTRGAHGVVRFVAHEQPAQFATLVNDCLTAFTPWRTSCHVPESFSPIDTPLPVFYFNGPDPDEEHGIEIKRMHALLHPLCLGRLLRALGFAPADERLEIPRFALPSQMTTVDTDQDFDDQGPDDPGSGTPLTTAEREELHAYLRERARKRQGAAARFLRFFANSEEVAQLDLAQTQQVRFALSDFAEFLEIQDDEGLLLARHQLHYDADDILQSQDVRLVLPNGLQFALRIAAAQPGLTPAIEITYDERGWWHRLQTWLTAWSEGLTLPQTVPLGALAVVLCASTAGFGLLWQHERRAAEHDRQTLAQLTEQQARTAQQLRELSEQARTAQTERATAEQQLQAAETRATQLQAQLDARPGSALSATAPQNLFVAEPQFLAGLKDSNAYLTLSLPAQASGYVLPFSINQPRTYPAYTLEIRNAAQQVTATLSNLQPQRFREDLLSATVTRAALPAPGAYQLRLFGQRGAQRVPLGQFTLRVQFN